MYYSLGGAKLATVALDRELHDILFNSVEVATQRQVPHTRSTPPPVTGIDISTGVGVGLSEAGVGGCADRGRLHSDAGACWLRLGCGCGCWLAGSGGCGDTRTQTHAHTRSLTHMLTHLRFGLRREMDLVRVFFPFLMLQSERARGRTRAFLGSLSLRATPNQVPTTARWLASLAACWQAEPQA